MRNNNWKIFTFFLALFICSLFLVCLNSMLETNDICFAWYACDEGGFCYETPIATPMKTSSIYHGFSYTPTALFPQDSLNILQLPPMPFAGDIGYYNTDIGGVANMANNPYIIRPPSSTLTLFNSEFISPGIIVTDGYSTGYGLTELTSYPPVAMFTLPRFPLPDVSSGTEYERVYPPGFFAVVPRCEDLYPVNNYLWWL